MWFRAMCNSGTRVESRCYLVYIYRFIMENSFHSMVQSRAENAVDTHTVVTLLPGCVLGWKCYTYKICVFCWGMQNAGEKVPTGQ